MSFENEKTILTLTMNGIKMSWEGNWDANMDDLLSAFYGLCVGHTFLPESVIGVMKDFALERMPEIENGDDNE